MESRPSAIATDSASRAQAEVVRLGYGDLPTGLAATFVVATGLAWIVARNHAATHAWVWLTTMLGVAAWRFSTVLSGIGDRWMGLMFDRWIGADYVKGLAKLKALAEKEAVSG